MPPMGMCSSPLKVIRNMVRPVGRSIDDMIAGASDRSSPLQNQPMDLFCGNRRTTQRRVGQYLGSRPSGCKSKCSAMADEPMEKETCVRTAVEGAKSQPPRFDIHGGGLRPPIPSTTRTKSPKALRQRPTDEMARYCCTTRCCRSEGKKSPSRW